jgi:hypothetical protein
LSTVNAITDVPAASTRRSSVSFASQARGAGLAIGSAPFGAACPSAR